MSDRPDLAGPTPAPQRRFGGVNVMAADYFDRVTRETPTRFWINNPTSAETEAALGAGAIGCTTNPTYCAKLIQSEPDAIRTIIDRVIRETRDDDRAADLVAQAATARSIDRFRPLFEESGGTQGFVTLQSDPRKDEDADELVEAALRYRSLGPNFMAKIPVTAAGLAAMERLIQENVPLCATEVFAIDQAIAICERYKRAASTAGRHPPLYVTHITGILDEYLGKLVAREGTGISSEAMVWAGSTVARTQYRLLRERGYPGTMLGGGARSTRHFTDFVGGEFPITINWSTARELLEWDPPVVPRIATETPPEIVNHLREKLRDFRLAIEPGSLAVEEFANFGPVQFFRNNFIAGYERLLAEIAARRRQ